MIRQDGSAVGERRRDLASLSLFADLSYPELGAVAHTFAEEAFAKDQRVLRQDVSGGSFYVILTLRRQPSRAAT